MVLFVSFFEHINREDKLYKYRFYQFICRNRPPYLHVGPNIDLEKYFQRTLAQILWGMADGERRTYAYIVVGCGGVGSAALYWLAKRAGKGKQHRQFTRNQLTYMYLQIYKL